MTKNRFGIATIAVGILAALSGLQDVAFGRRLLDDIGLSGLIAAVVPPWLGAVLTVLFSVFLLLWVFEPQLAVSDLWLGRKKLRATAFLTAKKMRGFADQADADYASKKIVRSEDNLLQRFWDRFPYETYQRLQDRMQVKIYGGVRPHVSKFMPKDPETIRQLANCIEEQALHIDADMLL